MRRAMTSRGRSSKADVDMCQSLSKHCGVACQIGNASTGFEGRLSCSIGSPIRTRG